MLRSDWPTYRFTGEAACLIGQCALKDLVDPGRRGRGVAVVVLGVQRAVGQPAVGLILPALLLQQVSDGVEQVVQELMSILLHVVIKEFWTERDIQRETEKERETERDMKRVTEGERHKET